MRAPRVGVAQARLGADEYAGVTPSAIVPLLRPTASSAVPANSTEWMNHMAQRRVTEIPEQFAR